MVSPVTSGGEEVYAEGESGQADTTGMSVTLTMDNPEQTTLVNNSKAGEVNYISSGFEVKTENVEGYNIYVQTAPGNTNKLTNGKITVDFVTTETPVSEFTDNTWGYAVDGDGVSPENLKYNPVPDTAASAMNPAYSSTSTGETRKFTLNFATKFAKDATPGHYTTGVLLSVAASTDTTVGLFDGITYMQEMTNGICSRAQENDTVQLVDSRDNKKYWVAKLRDGNCWMTQNLDLDIPAAGLSASDTDIPVDWNSSSAYKPVATTNDLSSFAASTAGINIVQSFDVGIYACGAGGCYKPTDDNYDRHHTVGNYYSWAAATAGQAALLTSETIEQATQSICPAHWGLPVQGAYNGLFSTYGTYQSGTFVYGEQNITSSPIYMVRGGYVAYRDGTGQILQVGTTGLYWTGTSYRSTSAYWLDFYTTSVNAKDANASRYTGVVVRCVAR